MKQNNMSSKEINDSHSHLSGLTSNKAFIYTLSFALPLFIMILLFVLRDIYPFGDNCYIHSDMYHQYVPFFSELWHKLREGGSLFYSWDIGLGSNFLAVFGYYLSSPVNWLIALFPQKTMIALMDALIVIKVAACGFTFTYYLCRHNRKCSISSVIFGMFYALSAFTTAYSWCLMWLDCVLLLPLVMLGLEKLVEEGKGLLYSVTLGLTILSNYYIAIMVCLSVFLYFIILMVSTLSRTDSRKYGRTIGSFIMYSLIAGGLSAVILIPEICALGGTASGDMSFPKTMTRYFSFVTMIERHMTNVDISTGLDHLPNIYCGVFIFLLLPLYIMCTKIPKREKIPKVILLLIFFTAFNFNIPNFIWHGFHYPNSLPCRQSFIYVFFLLGMCYEAFINLKSLKISNIAAVFWGVMIFFLYVGDNLTEDGQINCQILYLSAAYIAVYAFLLIIMKKTGGKNWCLTVAFMAAAIIEVSSNTMSTGYTTNRIKAYLSDFDTVKTLLDSEDEVNEGFGFCRTSKIRGYRSKNDDAWHNFKGSSVFSSTSYSALTDLYGDLGMEHSTNAYATNGATPFMYSLFNVKYLLSDEKIKGDIFDQVDSAGSEHLYSYDYALPLGFMVPSELSLWDSSADPNPFIVQNDLAYAMTGVEDLFTRITFEDNDTSATIVPDKDEYLYFYIMNKKIKSADVSIDGLKDSYTGIDHGRTIDLGFVNKGTEITISETPDNDNARGNGSLQMYAYVMDAGKLNEIYDILSKQGMRVLHYDDTHVTGSITALADGLLFTSIPYDRGYTIYVDGVKTEYEGLFNDALIAVPLSAGTHTIEFRYAPRGFKSGLIISIACLIILGGCIYFRIKFKKEITESIPSSERNLTVLSAHIKENTDDKVKDQTTGKDDGLK